MQSGQGFRGLRARTPEEGCRLRIHGLPLVLIPKSAILHSVLVCISYDPMYRGKGSTRSLPLDLYS